MEKKAFNIGICINHVARQLYDPLEIHYTIKISSCHHVICFETLVFRGGIEFQYIPFFFREWKSGPRMVLLNSNEKYSSFRHQGNKIMKHVNIDKKDWKTQRYKTLRVNSNPDICKPRFRKFRIYWQSSNILSGF